MEGSTYVWLGLGGLAGLLLLEYNKGMSLAQSISSAVTTSPFPSSTSNTVSVPATTTPSASSQSVQQTVAAQPTASQGTVASGVSQADIQALINTNAMTSLTPAQQAAMNQAQLSAFMANQARLVAANQATLSSGLPSVIPYAQAAALLQIPQSVVSSMKMGGSVGTAFGTFSLQPAGFITVDKVNPTTEAGLAAKNQTWLQYNGLAGLGSFLRSF